MRKVGGIVAVAFAVLLLAGPVMAADGGTSFSGAFGAGLVTIGGAYGIGRLAGSAAGRHGPSARGGWQYPDGDDYRRSAD